jgi:hypothetical protein
VLFVLLSQGVPAHAAFPGQNGRIAFYEYDGFTLHTVNADGTGQSDIGPGGYPRFSPDGTKIAIGGPSVMNVDGTNRTPVPNDGKSLADPAWSPDQRQIAGWWVACFSEANCIYEIRVLNVDGTGGRTIASADTDVDGFVRDPAWSPRGDLIAFQKNTQLWTVRPDGTGLTQVTQGSTRHDWEPDWSPDGTRLAVSGYANANADIYSMNADGSNVTRLTTDPGFDQWPAWSPDGSKIAFASNRNGTYQVFTMNADGTGVTLLSAIPTALAPDWQPIPYTGYARPKGATPMYASLVPAYNPCSAPNRTHGPPLAFGSCNPPAQSSGQLTVGSPDANGQTANSVGFAKYDAIAGVAGGADDADVKFTFSYTDVRLKSTLADYTGQLQATTTVQITDRLNGPATDEPATGSVDFPITVPCTGTGDTTIGSTCSITTSFDAVNPGSVTEIKRSIWQLDRIRVNDGGADGLVSTTPNTLFAVQGVFIP